MAFEVIIKPSAADDIRYYRTHEQRMIMDGITTHLTETPAEANKRRKPLRPNPVAPWELRVDIYRIFYAVEATTVTILSVGHKVHHVLYIRGKETTL
jgi:mRNA-degrading endonuclease RelE of RelBE toxin-antitoxin system